MIKYIILCLLFLGCSDPNKLNYRISEDKTMEILYLQGNVALVRKFIKNVTITLEGSTDKDVFEIVTANWLNKPTLSSQTGDDIDKTLVRDVDQIAKSPNGNIFYGTGKLYSEDWASEPESVYFILHNATVDLQKSENTFIQNLKTYGVSKIEMLSPSSFMATK